MKIQKRVLMVIFLSAVLAACNLPSATPVPTPTIDQALVGTIAAMTLEALHTQTPTVTPTVAATRTQTPTVTPTYAVPMLQFTGNSNCRKGPGPAYEVTTVVRAGQKAEAIGVWEKGFYWLIKNPNGAEACWVTNDYAKSSGSMQVLPTVTAPPTPTPRLPNAPTWSTYNFTCTFANGGSTMTIDLVWTDHSSDEAGYIVYRDGQAVTNLAANSTSYTDVAFVAAGQSLSYKVEVYNPAGNISSSAIGAACQ